jgi:ABC-type glutathione transport system ATPase component
VTVQPHEVVLRTKGLVKRFGSITAVDGLDLEVRRGEVVGLLGPNGAGKSTTIGMVRGSSPPTARTAEVLGPDVRVRRENALARVGVILEVTSFIHISRAATTSRRSRSYAVAGRSRGSIRCSLVWASDRVEAPSSVRIRSASGSASGSARPSSAIPRS